MSRRSTRNRCNRENNIDAFANAFQADTEAPTPRARTPSAPSAIERLAEGTNLQVDPIVPRQHIPPAFQNRGAVEDAVAAAEPLAAPAQLEPPAAAANVANPPQQPQADADPPQQQANQRRRQTTRQQRSRQRWPRRARAPRTVQTTKEKYEPSMRSLMDWKLHRIHMRGDEYSREEILSITDRDIYRWMKHRVYGDETVDEAITPPIHYRHYSVQFWKKAISFFMVNSHMQWNEETNTGNPTKSKLVAKLLKYIKRFQVQGRGKESKVRRAFTQEEFEQLQELIWELPDKEDALCAAAYFAFQYSMMARLDDTAKARLPDLHIYRSYPECAVTARLPWAKNCNEERDAPPQILLGAMDPRYDVLSLLGLWLEYRFENHPQGVQFIFCIDGEDDPIRIKEIIRLQLSRALGHEDFVIRDEGPLGTHSTRKLSVTIARGNGCWKVRGMIGTVCFYSMNVRITILLLRMIVTQEAAGKTQDASTRLMQTSVYHMLTPRLQQHCVKVALSPTKLLVSQGSPMGGF